MTFCSGSLGLSVTGKLAVYLLKYAVTYESFTPFMINTPLSSPVCACFIAVSLFRDNIHIRDNPGARGKSRDVIKTRQRCAFTARVVSDNNLKFSSFIILPMYDDKISKPFVMGGRYIVR